MFKVEDNGGSIPMTTTNLDQTEAQQPPSEEGVQDESFFSLARQLVHGEHPTQKMKECTVEGGTLVTRVNFLVQSRNLKGSHFDWPLSNCFSLSLFRDHPKLDYLL